MPFRLIRLIFAVHAIASVLFFSGAAGAQSYRLDDTPPFASALLVEAETGTVLFEHNADEPRSPASTQKLLLQLVVMDAVASGRAALTDSVYASALASGMGGSQVYLRHGEVFPLGELMEAIAIASANDACVAVAEHLGGSVDGFVDLMNQRAADLGLENTHCVNVHGLDDTPQGEGNVTTARDLSRIARALLAHGQILEWSAIRYKPFRQGDFMLYTTNKLLGRFPDLDGLKTGFTQRAGYCLVATAERRDMRLVSVIMGGKAERLRDQETARLLGWGFNHYTKAPIVRAGEHMGDVTLDWGVEPAVQAVIADTVLAVLTAEDRRRLKRHIELPELFPAPVEIGGHIGDLRITLGDSLLARIDIVAASSVARMTFWEKLMSYF